MSTAKDPKAQMVATLDGEIKLFEKAISTKEAIIRCCYRVGIGYDEHRKRPKGTDGGDVGRGDKVI
eukprot:CAMPEP_0167752594 /NCGR_PEP_ID=MMETSP0110_2-20121227/7228_1 /TAXON_ID=629695 /ORGANISM="Gymnochlora sp., Strain CCMP2014" /LENGTH=65 /DNA_ID=CAMNT_0007638233 /DNA_START=64 /DNA_END=261 /DNA_ORIENTATION=-